MGYDYYRQDDVSIHDSKESKLNFSSNSSSVWCLIFCVLFEVQT